MFRLSISLVLAFLLCSLPAFAALTLGPERDVAPSTTSVQFDGASVALAASGSDFLAVWHSWETSASFATRLDENGRVIDAVGNRLPVELHNEAALWTGAEYVIAGFNMAKGILAMRTGGEPRFIADVYYAYDLRLSFNGSVLLLTWVSQSNLTQTMEGVLLEPDLDVIRAPFVITTRDVSGMSMPLDHWTSPSVATNGNHFLVSWEMVPALTIVSPSGEVTRGGAITAGMLQPTVVATNGGLILLGHDRSVIRAQRVASDGTALTSPVELVHEPGIAEIAAAGIGSELAIVWRSGSSECNAAPIFARRFDASFETVGERRRLSETAGFGMSVAVGETMVATWVAVSCSFGNSVIRTASMSEPQETISAFIAPSAQTDVDAATEGATVLTIWTEQRDSDPEPRIYGAVLDQDGNIRRSLDIASGEHGRVAFGDGRYLVAWQHGSAIFARFLDGDPFRVADAAASAFELVWDGERFVFAWNEDTTLRSAFVSPSGFVAAGPSVEEAGALADLTAGPHGEVAALYRFETAAQLHVRVATLRTEWHVEGTLATAPRPCLGKRCPDYNLIAIGWSGRDYLIVWKRTDGPPYGAFIESRALHGATTRLVYLYNNFGALGGELAWNGSAFVLTLQMPGLVAWWPLSYVARISDSGSLLDNFEPVTTIEGASPPALALLRPDRAVVVYNRTVGLTQRVASRSLDIAPSLRRRAARH